MNKTSYNKGVNSRIAAVLAALPFFAGMAIGSPALPAFTLQANQNGSALNAPSGSNTSLNWSGYSTTGGTFTGVGASWSVPESTAATSSPESLSADATWVGIGGVASTDLIQAGTQTIFQNGSPTYQAWYETLPESSVQVPLTIHPGDAMTVGISEPSTNDWQISFDDMTTGQTYTASVSYQSSLSSAEWIEEMPSDGRGFVALDNFGTASFTDAYAIENGSQENLSEANAQPMTMITNAGQALAVPSSLSTDDASFTISRTNLSSSASVSGIEPGREGRWSRTGVGIQGYSPSSRGSRGSYLGFGGFGRFGGFVTSSLGQGFQSQSWQTFRGSFGNMASQLNSLRIELQSLHESRMRNW
jgi:hypothetical protein